MSAEATLDGYFKEVYAGNIEDLIPRPMRVQQAVKFSEAQKIGKDYHQPVIVQDEAGTTYSAQSLASSAAFSLNDAVGGVEQDAIVTSAEIVMRSWISYQQAARAMGGGKKSFGDVTGDRFKNNLKSMRKRVEIGLLHGNGSSGAAADNGIGVTASSSNVSATTTNVVLTAATWASGIWSGLTGAKVNFYDNAVLVSSAADAIFTVTSVAPATRTILFTGTATGITALDSAISSDPTQVKIFLQGSYGAQTYGLIKIAKHTAGELFSINATTYSLWQGNAVTLSGAPTMGKFLGGLAPAVGRGLDEDGELLVSPATWNDLNTNEAALRVYDSSYKISESESGNQQICYYGQNGKITVFPHPYMFAGEALFYVPSQCERVGSIDVTYQQPGRGGRIFFDIPDRAGYEFRSYTDQAVYCKKPATLIHFSGFTNATAS